MKYILFIIIVALFFWAMVTGLNKQERVDCYKWQSQAQEFEGFYLTQWQAEQCEAHAIPINAPVR